MASTFLFNHSLSGYSITAQSGSGDDIVASKSIESFVGSLHINPQDLEIGDGWIWSELNSKIRVFARIRLVESQTRRPALELRLLCLNEVECEQIDWNPFAYTHVLHDDQYWKASEQFTLVSPGGPKALPPARARVSSIPFPPTLPWQPIAPCTEEVMHQCIRLLSTSDRRTFTFAGPTSATDLGYTLVLTPGDFVRRTIPQRKKITLQQSWSIRSIIFGVLIATCLAGIGFVPFYRNAERVQAELGQERVVSESRLQAIEQLENELKSINDANEESLIAIQNGIRSLATEYTSGVVDENGITDDFRRRWNIVDHHLRSVEGLNSALSEWRDLERQYAPTRDRLNEFQKCIDKLRDDLNRVNETVQRRSSNPPTRLSEAEKKQFRMALEEVLNTTNELRQLLETHDPNS